MLEHKIFILNRKSEAELSKVTHSTGFGFIPLSLESLLSFFLLYLFLPQSSLFTLRWSTLEFCDKLNKA